MTALLSASEKCESLHQRTCFVTFDQPLYFKAREIVSSYEEDSKLSNTVVRLGGFHLLMSFMGSIGYIMNGSGLKELFNTIYATHSIEKIMAGHAYSRAVRAHMLTHLSIAKIVLQSIEFTPDLRAELERILYDFDRSVVLEADQEECYQELSEKFETQLVKFEHRGATAKLWVQYFRMVTLVKQFIEAERMGNWNLHLDTIQKMIPYFHASGHFLYAKSCHLYLQDMFDLKQRMTAEEYELFTTKGYFTIRRSDKFWCGTWSDMTIEQSLMRTMKCLGGLTHGRGVQESVLSKWTLGMVFLHNICDEVEKFCNVDFSSSEQHVEMRSSRVNRDNDDVKKLMDWLCNHPPFPEVKDIMSISTGVIGDEKINCHMSYEIGCTGISKIIGSDFYTVKFKRNDRIKSLGVMNTAIRIEEDIVPINPLLIFQRMCIAKESEQELEKFLTYELAPFPLSLFNDEGMRKCVKSSMYKAFKVHSGDINFGDTMYVIDGGHLLHRVIWHRGESFSSICNNYVTYVRSKYKSNVIIVFDGYPEDAANRSTKYAERFRRSRKTTSVDILFDETMIPTVSQSKFLGNDANKNRLIRMLKTKFEAENVMVKQATEDADSLIINTAISVSSAFDSVIVVGEDVDLLILLTALSKLSNMYMLKPGKGKISQQIYSTDSIIDKTAADHILFLHAFSGCDTTCALFNQGKTKFINVLRKNPNLSEVIQAFKNPNADPEIIAKAGERFLLELYSYSDVKNKKSMSLNDYRYECFIKSAYKSKFNIASLPPTEAAARQHSFRTYHQIQQWCGNEKNAEQWGSNRNKNGLIPVMTHEPPAPESLLKLISCKCKKGCQKACGCRKAGLKCSIICTNCTGGTCDNSQNPSHDSDEEEETETIFEQTNDGIENEEAHDEFDDPIADDTEEISVCNVSIATEDDELATPGPSRTSKRRRLR